MPRNDEVMVPVAFVVRWLQESVDKADFEARFDRYVISHPSNWSVPEAPD